MFTTLLLTKLRTDVVFLGAIGLLYVTGVLDSKEAFSGFSSTSVVVIGVLFVVVAGLTHTGVLQWIVNPYLSWQTFPDIGVGLVGSEAAGLCRCLFR